MDKDTIAGHISDIVDRFYPGAKLTSMQTINGFIHFYYRASERIDIPNESPRAAMIAADLPSTVMLHIEYEDAR